MIVNGKNYSEEIKNFLLRIQKILMNAFLEITVFHLFLFATEIFRDSLLILKYLIICVKYFYIFRLNL